MAVTVEPFMRMKIQLYVVVFLNIFGTLAVGLNYPNILKSILIDTHPHLHRNDLIALASTYKSLLDALAAALQFLCLPILGGVSDLIGRKPILLYSTISTVIAVVTVVLAYQTDSIWMLFLAKFFGYTTQTMVYLANAYISDISTPESKAKDFGRVSGVYALGLVLSPLAFGAILLHTNITFTLLCGGCVCFLNIIVVIFLPETIGYSRAREVLNTQEGAAIYRPRLITRFNPFRTWGVICNRANVFICCVACIYILYAVGESDILDTAYLYTEYRYGWNVGEYSLYTSVQGGAMALYQGLIFGFTAKKYGEKNTLTVALFVAAFAHLVIAFAFEWWIFVGTIVLSCMATGAGPSLYAIVSKNVPTKDIGSAMTALGSFFSLSQFVGALVMENIFAFFISSKSAVEFPGAHFVLGSFLLLLGAVGTVLLFKRYPHGTEAKYMEERTAILPTQDLSKRRFATSTSPLGRSTDSDFAGYNSSMIESEVE